MKSVESAGWIRRHLVPIVLASALSLGVATASPSAAEPTSPLPDGLTPATAAASCWEIKQNAPTSRSGAYWLLTPALKAPARFYCDQEYLGGGWVLVGKGRERWEEYYQGQGPESALADRPQTVTPGYFGTVQLPSPTIDGLLNGHPVSSLTDGVRLLRARNAAGNSWQNVQFRMAQANRWVWTHGAVHPITAYRFDQNSWRSGGTTQNYGTDSGYNRVASGVSSSQGYTTGYAYGSLISGSNNATTFLWSATNGRGAARPYTEVYLRPELTTADVGWSALPDDGASATTIRPIASSYAAPGNWGVSGHLNGRTAEGNTEVQAFAQLGDTVFVGGNFTTVSRYTGGQLDVSQAALAAFNAHTGEFIPSFTPTFNNQVKALQALPNGKLLAAGDFTQVNGQPAVGTVLLDPQTGAIEPQWDLRVENRLSTGVLSVRSLSLSGDHVYLGGSFTHLSGSGVSNVYARHAARVSWSTGAPDPTWNPEFNGTLVDVDAPADGTRMYAAGYFTQSKTAPANKVAAVLATAGAPLADPSWSPVWSASDRSGYQQAIQAVGDVVYTGGSEHSVFGFNTTTFERVSGNITYGVGGDFQTLATDGSVIYGGCHCSTWTFQNAFTWPTVTPGWQQADSIRWIGAWDAATGEYLPAFEPPFLRSNNAGAWASFVADDQTLWVGGDFTNARISANQGQRVGGFVRFPMVDHAAPPTPGDIELIASDSDQATLSWSASTGQEQVSYEILRDDRVIATSTVPSATVPTGGLNRFFVRAVDQAGNRSATTPVLDLDNAPEPPSVVLPSGSTWTYHYEAAAPGSDWASNTFDDQSWSTGQAPIGWGHASVQTQLAEGIAVSQRPITAYFRHDIDLADPPTVHSLKITAIADDGAVVYVNGIEVGRARMADGPVTHTTYSHSAISTTNALNNPLVIDVPRHVLVEGTNTIGVETHLNYRSTPNIHFDASATVTTGDPIPIEEPPVEEPPAEEPPAEKPLELLAAGSTWAYRYEKDAPESTWASGVFDDTSWSRGPAPLGWGHPSIQTALGPGLAPSDRPRTAYFRHDFDIADTATIDSVTISAIADDGAVVYVNGTEVGRARMGDGTITHLTFSHSAISTTAALAAPLVIEVPQSLLVNGTNTLAVETHLNYRSTPNIHFNASVSATMQQPD